MIYVYNPTDQRRIQMVKVLLDTHQVTVTSDKQAVRACQIDPKWKGKRSNTMETNRFEVSFKSSFLLRISNFSSLFSFYFLPMSKPIH